MAEIRKIGIPRTLYFYTFFPLWKTFFEELGMEVIFSPPTNAALMDYGIKDTVNDACIPIKVFHGHVASLRSKVDYIFIPRLVSLDGKSTLCPKFLGLPDMVRSSVEHLPNVVVESLHLKRFWALPRFFLRLGKKFTTTSGSSGGPTLKLLIVGKPIKSSFCRGITPAHWRGTGMASSWCPISLEEKDG